MSDRLLNKWDQRLQEHEAGLLDEAVPAPDYITAQTTYRIMRAQEVFNQLSLSAREELLNIESPIVETPLEVRAIRTVD